MVKKRADSNQTAGKSFVNTRKKSVQNTFGWIVASLILLAITYSILSHESETPVENQVLGVVIPPPICHALPPHGAVHIIEPSVMKRTDVLYSGLQIYNQHDHSLVAILSGVSDSVNYFAVSIAPSEKVLLSVPVGQYGMDLFVGSDWCNLETGFSDGAQISVVGGLLVQVGLTSELEFHGAGINPVQLALAYNTFRPVSHEKPERPSEIIGSGEMELLQANNGHYFSSGTINDTPVIFLIDTGATYVSVSSEIALRAGIQECLPRPVMTANGKVDACTAIVPEITFGAFHLNNIEVTVMPNMSEEALLGMNVLRNFRIEQVDNVMRISLR